MIGVKEWRKAQRQRLLGLREAMTDEVRRQKTQIITTHIQENFLLQAWERTGFYWPFRGEFDPRFIVKQLRDLNKVVALPEVVEKNSPLQFRQWWLGVAVQKGVYDLPVPVDTPLVKPAVLLVPPIGFDEQGYRLGYGGGYFDRTLVVAQPRPVTIAVAFELNRLDSIQPQSHDIPMDFVVTEIGVHAVVESKLELVTDREKIQYLFNEWLNR